MNTSKITALLLMILVSSVVWAQKGSVTKADGYRLKKDYINAKAEIDMAITIEKAAGKVRTWYVRGQIYEEIAKSKDEGIYYVDENAASNATEAYKKVMEMDKPGGNYYSLSEVALGNLWGALINNGGEKYDQGDFEGALTHFENSLQVKPADSLSLFYAGTASQQLDNTDKILYYYGEMFKNDYAGEDVMLALTYYYRTSKKEEEALEVVRGGRKKYPKNEKFAKEELNILLTLNRVDEAKNELKAAIQKDPSDLMSHLNLGVLYDNIGSKLLEEGKQAEGEATLDSASRSYDKAIAIEPDNYIANYNSGAILVNQAKVYLDEARDMDLRTYQKKGKPLEDKAKGILERALPYFQTVTRVKPDDIDAWTSLQSIYNILKMNDKAEEAFNKVEELEAGR